MKAARNANLPLVLWAVDPLANEVKLQQETARALKTLASRKAFCIQPVCAVPHPLPNLPETFTAEVFREVRKKAQDEFNRLIRKIQLKNVLPLAVLEVPHRSVSQQVEAVISYAIEAKAEMIVASTRSRRGPSRWFVGSFAETLGLRSPIPIFLVNPSWKGRFAFKEILFPTDFSDASHEVFGKVIALAKSTGSKIHIFHKFGFDLAPAWDLNFSATRIYGDQAAEELTRTKHLAKKWRQEAVEAGAEAIAEVDDRSTQPVAEAILARAKKLPCLIALAGESSAFEAGFLGSIVRRVVRECVNPVWLLHASPRAWAKAPTPDVRTPRKPETRSQVLI